jgi:hypothetical protein
VDEWVALTGSLEVGLVSTNEVVLLSHQFSGEGLELYITIMLKVEAISIEVHFI